MLKKPLFRTALALAGLLALGAPSAPGQVPPGGKQPPPGPAVKPGGKTAEWPATHLKAFALTHVDPEEVRQVLPQLINATNAPKPGQPPGAAGQPGAADTATLRMAVDPRSHTLFVRGSDKELGAVSDIVAVLEGDPSKVPVGGKSMRIVRLKHTKVQEVLGVLNNLGYQGQIIALPKANSVVLTQPEAEAKEIREVIEKMDVAGEPAAKTAQKSS
jgi:type II secretory pathway component GspD/PulD (secretin)